MGMSGPNAASALGNFAGANQAAVGAAAQLQDENGASCASMEASGCLTKRLPSAALGVFDPALTEAESCLATCSACFEPFQPNLKALAGGVIAEMSGPNAASALGNFAGANQAAVGAAAQLQDGNGASCASMEASGCLTKCLPSVALGVFDPALTEAESCLATCSACFEPFQPNLKA